MLSKNGIVPIGINKRYTFYKNERSSSLDIISTNEGLAKKHKGNKKLNTLSISDYTYALHDLETIKTRRNVDNFKYLTKEMDTDKFILKFDFNYQNLFIHNSNDKEAHAECFRVTVETTCASELKKVYPPIRKNVETIGGVKTQRYLGGRCLNFKVQRAENKN